MTRSKREEVHGGITPGRFCSSLSRIKEYLWLGKKEKKMVLKNDGLYNDFGANSDVPNENITPMDEEDVIYKRELEADNDKISENDDVSYTCYRPCKGISLNCLRFKTKKEFIKDTARGFGILVRDSVYSRIHMLTRGGGDCGSKVRLLEES